MAGRSCMPILQVPGGQSTMERDSRAEKKTTADELKTVAPPP